MRGVPVTIAPATEAGRLYPRYANTIGIFTLESAPPRAWPHGVNIDGTIILDFDKDRVLARVELLAPMSAWKSKDATAQPIGRPADLRLSGNISGNLSFDWPVIVSKDVQRDEARVEFGGEFNRAVALSNSVVALLEDDRLSGFWFTFGR